MTQRADIQEAAALAEAGLDAMRWLTTSDETERLSMQAIGRVVLSRRAEANRG